MRWPREGDKPQFKPFKTMFDTDSGRAGIKIKIAVPDKQTISYIYSNPYLDPVWYGGVAEQTTTDFCAHSHEGKEWWEIGDGLPHHTTISSRIRKGIWIYIAYSLVIRYRDFYLYSRPTGVGIKHGLNSLNCGLSSSVPSLATPCLLGAPLNYNFKPHFKRPFKTMFDTNSGRAAIKIKIVILSNRITSYISPNSYTDRGWYGGLVRQTIIDFPSFPCTLSWGHRNDGKLLMVCPTTPPHQLGSV